MGTPAKMDLSILNFHMALNSTLLKHLSAIGHCLIAWLKHKQLVSATSCRNHGSA